MQNSENARGSELTGTGGNVLQGPARSLRPLWGQCDDEPPRLGPALGPSGQHLKRKVNCVLNTVRCLVSFFQWLPSGRCLCCILQIRSVNSEELTDSLEVTMKVAEQDLSLYPSNADSAQPPTSPHLKFTFGPWGRASQPAFLISLVLASPGLSFPICGNK